MYVVEFLHEKYGWRKYLRKFPEQEEATKVASEMYSTLDHIKNFRVNELTEENKREYNL